MDYEIASVVGVALVFMVAIGIYQLFQCTRANQTRRRFEKRVSTFEQLVKKYRLVGRVDLREDWRFGRIYWSLIPIRDEAKLTNPLPPAFVEEVQCLGDRWYSDFRVGKPMTIDEIHRYQEAWSAYCEEA